MADESTALFKEAVNEFVGIHKQLAEASKSLSLVRKKKNDLAEVILEYMIQNNYEVCSHEGAKLIRKSQNKRSAMKDEHIIGAITEFLGSDVDTTKIMEIANSKREVVVKPSLSCRIIK